MVLSDRRPPTGWYPAPSLWLAGNAGPYADLARSKVGALEAERRAIAAAVTGAPVRARDPEQRKGVPTVREFSEKFLATYAASHKASSKLDKRHRLNAYILPAVGDLKLDEVRQEHIDGLVAELLRRGLARKTANNITAVLSSLVKYAVRNKVIGPVDLSFIIKAQDTELVAVAAEDVDRLVVAATDPRYRAAILLASDGGLRIGEVRALGWSGVNELAREVTISHSFDRTGVLSETKGWERRTVPISDRLWTALRALPRSSRWVVPQIEADRPLGYDTTRESVRAIYDQAGVSIPAQPWHSLRHAFGTRLANAGVPVHVIRVLMGHKAIETTLRYMHTDRAAKRDAIAALRGSHVGECQESCRVTRGQESRVATPCPGLRRTVATGVQLRVWRVQRPGRRARASR